MRMEPAQIDLFDDKQSAQVINLIPHIVRRIFRDRGKTRLRREGAVVQITRRTA